MKPKHLLCVLIVLLFVSSSVAARSFFLDGRRSSYQHYEGLSVFVDAGMLMPNAKQSNFYSGREGNPNTISRVLYSNSFGQEIWTSLRNDGYLQGVGSFSEIQLADYPEMYYKLTYQIGLGLRYSYRGGWGWLLRFDYSQLTAAGVFHLYNGPQAGILTNQERYVTCGMFGQERRIFIDIAASKRFYLGSNFLMQMDVGFNINNTKVMENQMEIGGRYYSILDIWNGQTPYVGVGTYEYINQGGLGYGPFASVALSYEIAGFGSVDLGYSCYYTKTLYKGYNDNDAFAFQHLLFVRANLCNFSFF